MSAKFTTRHFVALDHAVAAGVTIEHNGKSYTFSPLSFADMGKIVSKARGLALQAYLDTTKPTLPQRQRDINAILFGSSG